MRNFLLTVLCLKCAFAFAGNAADDFFLRDLGAGNAEILAYNGRGSEVSVPEKIDGKRIVRIGENAFFGNANIRSVTLPDTLSEVASYAFAHCSNLSEVAFPQNLEKIGARAFFACEKLSEISLPAVIKNIGDEAFAFCSSAKSVTAPPEADFLGENAFPLTSPELFPESRFASLKIDSAGLALSEPSGNFAIDGAESCTICVPVKNIGNATAYGSRVRIVLQKPDANLVFSSAHGIFKIPAGETFVAKIPIRASRELGEGTISLEIFAEESRGFHSEKQILSLETRPFVAPALKIVDFVVSGQGNSVLKKNTPFDLQLFLQNTTAGTAEDVSVSLELPPEVMLLDGEKSRRFSALSAGEAKPLEFSLLVPRRYAGSEIPVRVSISEKYGEFSENWETVLQLNSAIASAKTVVAQEDGNAKIELASFTSEVDKNIPVNAEIPARNIFVAIVANEDYRYVAPVNFAGNDGRIFYEYCRKTLGVPERQIRFFKNATVGDMNLALNWLEKRGKLEDAELIFYYSGHGVPDDETRTAYLLPTDGNPSDLGFLRSLNDVYTQLSRSRAKFAVAFLDACFSGMRRDNAPVVAAKGVRRAVPAGDISSLSPNLVVFTAASGDQTAHFAASEKHGLFTYALLKKLQETRGNVSLGELGQYLTETVPAQSLKFGDFEQTPGVFAHEDFPHWDKNLYPQPEK